LALQDADLRSLQEARALAARAKAAQAVLGAFTQEQVDRIVEAMASAAKGEAERLAKMAHEETGFGNVKDKTTKNLFSSVHVANYLRGLRTVGVLHEDAEKGITEIAEPMGVVAAIIPSTNPTSTAIFKALLAIKARDAIVMSPHPSARRCITETAQILRQAGIAAGMPEDALLCLTEVSVEGTQELMKSRDTGVVLATGGIGLVRAAYSSGRPAYGVGPGNVPVYLHASADPETAVGHVVDGKTFDYGTLCSSEQALVVDQDVRDRAVAALQARGGYFLNDAEAAAVAKVVVTPQRLANPEIVGRPAPFIAQKAGVKVPDGTRVLVAPLTGVGREFPLSIEKLCPVLAFYTVKDWKEGAERCRQVLRFGGTGHTAGIHCADDRIVREFAFLQPAFRIIVNTMTSMGATGYTTRLAPSLSLGCGAYAGNITSDNITPFHLINRKRVARVIPSSDPGKPVATAPSGPPPAAGGDGPLLDFVSEDDVRRALREGRTLRLAARAIVTPAAQDLAQGTGVLVPSGEGGRKIQR
jgi:acetaldehyde dehydrogenase (acetylating)